MLEKITPTPDTLPSVDGVEDRTQFPPGYLYNPDLLEDVDEQIAGAWKEHDYQERELPSFENTPAVDITPTFDPTGADADELLIEGFSPNSLRQVGLRPHSEYPGINDEPIVIWRIVDRASLRDGTGITSSSVLEGAPVEDSGDLIMHFASNQATRTGSKLTPFVSFSTDPENLVQLLIRKHEFGLKDGRDSVVVQATVDPGRILSHGHKKEAEVLLMGGLGRHEYNKAMEVTDFVNTVEMGR